MRDKPHIAVEGGLVRVYRVYRGIVGRTPNLVVTMPEKSGGLGGALRRIKNAAVFRRK